MVTEASWFFAKTDMSILYVCLVSPLAGDDVSIFHLQTEHMIYFLHVCVDISAALFSLQWSPHFCFRNMFHTARSFVLFVGGKIHFFSIKLGCVFNFSRSWPKTWEFVWKPEKRTELGWAMSGDVSSWRTFQGHWPTSEHDGSRVYNPFSRPKLPNSFWMIENWHTKLIARWSFSKTATIWNCFFQVTCRNRSWTWS